MRLAIAIRTATRSSVMKPEQHHVSDLPDRHLAVHEARGPPQREQAPMSDRARRTRRRSPKRSSQRFSGPRRVAAGVERRPRLHAGAQQRGEGAADEPEKARAAHHGERPGAVRREPRFLLQAEPVGARDQRPEQQLIEDQDHDEHGRDRPADGGVVALLDGERDVGADPGHRHGGAADADRLGGHHEEPAARTSTSSCSR